VIRLIATSDSHYRADRRLEETVNVHREIVRLADYHRADAILHAGDFFERRSTGAERLALFDFLTEAGDHGIPVYGVKGNHDAPDDLTLFSRAIHGVSIAERPMVTILPRGDGRCSVAVVQIPWFDRVHIAAAVDVLDPQKVRDLTIDAAQQFLTAIRGTIAYYKAEGYVVVVVSHMMVAGSVVSSGQCLIGAGVELTPHDLMELGASYVALGHVHKTQEWYEGRVCYSGSPEAHDFGEPEEKGVRLVTLEEDGTFVSNEFLPLGSRKIVLLEDTAGWGPDTDDEVKDAVVRLRLHLTPDEAAALDRQATIDLVMSQGAFSCKLEIVTVQPDRQRVPEIARAVSLPEKLEHYMKARGDDPERLPALVEKVGVLEGMEVTS
jgi:DNA repair exonuclease SbcCD nuclease subunit